MSGVVDSGRELGYDNIDANEPELPFGRASEFATGAFPLPIALRDGERCYGAGDEGVAPSLLPKPTDGAPRCNGTT